MERIREMIIKICDVCKKRIEKDEKHYQMVRKVAFGERKDSKIIDVCQNCLNNNVIKDIQNVKAMNEPKYAMKICDSCYYISSKGECDNSCSNRSSLPQVYGLPACPNYSEDV